MSLKQPVGTSLPLSLDPGQEQCPYPTGALLAPFPFSPSVPHSIWPLITFSFTLKISHVARQLHLFCLSPNVPLPLSFLSCDAATNLCGGNLPLPLPPVGRPGRGPAKSCTVASDCPLRIDVRAHSRSFLTALSNVGSVASHLAASFAIKTY